MSSSILMMTYKVILNYNTLTCITETQRLFIDEECRGNINVETTAIITRVKALRIIPASKAVK